MAITPQQPSPASRILKLFKRRAMQRVDATILLRLDDPAIDRDAKILDLLLSAARRTILDRRQWAVLKTHSPLYRRYRGTAFPLKTRENRRLPPWRSLTPWMKTQVAGLCLAERPIMPFRVHLHDELSAELLDRGQDPKDYFRDNLKRVMRRTIGPVTPWFFTVVEDRSKTGLSKVRPHFHGSISIPQHPLPLTAKGAVRIRHRILERQIGLVDAEYALGRELVWEAVRAASGNDGKRPKVVDGQSQNANMWSAKSYRALFNDAWISYAFKNAKAVSWVLPDNRLTISRGLNREAQRLWNLIRDGESALDQWQP